MYKKGKALMDTFVTITVVSSSENEAEKAIENAFNAIEKYGKLIDFFSENSEISLINKNAGIKPVKVTAEVLDTIIQAVYVAEKSEGAFDPTIGPVIKLWDFHKGIKPDDFAIRNTLRLVDYRKIIINRQDSTIFLKDKGMLIDPGGIAKGYAADIGVRVLKENGIRSGIVAIAGDIRCFGSRPDGKPWIVGIRNPRQKSEHDEIIARISLIDAAISTSGDYERYFEQEGTRYHHLLDPRTGYPSNRSRSVSIISDRGVFSDAFSTAVFIAGTEKGLFITKNEGFNAIIFDDKGTIHTTDGLKEKIKFEKIN